LKLVSAAADFTRRAAGVVRLSGCDGERRLR